MTRPFTGLALALSFLAIPAAAQAIDAQRLQGEIAKANGKIWKVTGTTQVEPPVPSATPAPPPSPSR